MNNYLNFIEVLYANIFGTIDYLFVLLIVIIAIAVKSNMYFDSNYIEVDCKYRVSYKSDFYTLIVAFVMSFMLIQIMQYDLNYIYVFWNSIAFALIAKTAFSGLFMILIDDIIPFFKKK